MKPVSNDLLGLAEASSLDEATLEIHLRELSDRAHQMEAQRMQDLVVSFSAGLAIVVGLVVLSRALPRIASSEESSAYEGLGDRNAVAVE